MSETTYHLRKESKTNGFIFRDYIARLDDMTPVDSFQLFRTYTDRQWTAWTSDTFNQKLAETRRAFAERINTEAQPVL